MTERWHYGTDRLEIALRNFFGQEHDFMRLYLTVPSQCEVRIMISTRPECTHHLKLEPEQVLGFIEDTLEKIKDYLGLSMRLVEIRKMEGLTAFAAEENQVNTFQN